MTWQSLKVTWGDPLLFSLELEHPASAALPDPPNPDSRNRDHESFAWSVHRTTQKAMRLAWELGILSQVFPWVTRCATSVKSASQSRIRLMLDKKGLKVDGHCSNVSRAEHREGFPLLSKASSPLQIDIFSPSHDILETRFQSNITQTSWIKWSNFGHTTFFSWFGCCLDMDICLGSCKGRKHITGEKGKLLSQETCDRVVSL